MMPDKRFGKWPQFLLAILLVMGCCGQAMASSATLTVNGSEQQISGSWDSSNITVAFNGYTETVHYAQFSTPASLASALAAMFSRDYIGAGLCAHASGAVLTFVLQGSVPFGTLDIEGPGTSFQFSSSGFQSTTAAPADTGTVTLTVNGVVAATTTYGAGATPETVAADLAGGMKANSPATVLAVNDAVYLQSTSSGANSDYSYSLVVIDTAGFSQPSFAASPASGSLEGGANANSGGSTPRYSYSITTPTGASGYAANGNVQNYTDSVMGTWSFSYDTLNRLLSGQQTSTPTDPHAPPVPSPNYCWVYDAFGNLEGEYGFASGGSCNPPQLLTYANNQAVAVSGGPPVPIYDPSGNGDIVVDTKGQQYLYDAEGRICAVQSGTVDGIALWMGYVYDGEGRRVAKGTINPPSPGTNPSCDPSSNGFSPTLNETDYVLDQDGHQVTEIASDGNGGMNWAHTNVWAGGQLVGTYEAILDPPCQSNGQHCQSGCDQVGQSCPDGALHFYLADWLGSRRVQTDYAGALEQDCSSLPFGDQFNCTQTIQGPTEHHYTGKERDTESGNDYFGARYYGSSMGRFLSPDPVIITPDRLANPQQLNLYAYVANNPLRFIDPTGEILQCVGDDKSRSQCFSDLQQIAGDAKDRLSMDAKTGVVSFDTKDLDMSKNEGASLVNGLVGSKNTYDFSVGPTIMTDKGPVRVDHIGTDMANLPAFGDQRQIGNPPAGVSDILDIYFNNPNMTRVSNTNLQVAPEWTVAFHELAEAYEKIDGGKGGSYAAGHNAALQREMTLRDQRPYLKQYNTGAGGPANSPNPQGGIIIKK
jgi:RHS repeat-associated protein